MLRDGILFLIRGNRMMEELLKSLKSLVEYFAKSGQADEIAKNVLFSISSEEVEDDNYPHVIQVLSLLKEYNPKRWNEFLKMFKTESVAINKILGEYPVVMGKFPKKYHSEIKAELTANGFGTVTNFLIIK